MQDIFHACVKYYTYMSQYAPCAFIRYVMFLLEFNSSVLLTDSFASLISYDPLPHRLLIIVAKKSFVVQILINITWGHTILGILSLVAYSLHEANAF